MPLLFFLSNLEAAYGGGHKVVWDTGLSGGLNASAFTQKTIVPALGQPR